VPQRDRRALLRPRPHRGDMRDSPAGVWVIRFFLKGSVALRCLQCVTTGHTVKPVPIAVSSNSVRCATDHQPNRITVVCSTRARLWLSRSVCPNLLAGANMARHEAYRHLVARGFRTEIQGVAMHKNNDPGYCRAGAYVIDDWR
jgi:hypothetical protein